MPLASTSEIALLIGDTPFAELPAKDQSRISKYLTEVEAVLSNPPWNFRLLTATVTEYLPFSGTDSVDDIELAQYDSDGAFAIPLDNQVSRTGLQLTHTPVLVTSLQVWEDIDGRGGQGTDPFPASTLLTLGTDYYLDVSRAGISTSGVLHRLTGGWSRVPRSIKVTYLGGPAAQDADSLGVSFLPILKSVIETSVVDRYTAWKQIQDSLTGDHVGRVAQSETIGKHSESFRALGAGSGANGGGFGQSVTILPDYLAEQLSPFVNIGALLRR